VNALAGPLGDALDMNRGWAIAIDALRDTFSSGLRRPLLLLLAGSIVLLTIACSNVVGSGWSARPRAREIWQSARRLARRERG